MEIPIEILVHNETLGVKGTEGRLLQIGEEGFYEVNLQFGGSLHRVLLPVSSTVIISKEPEAELGDAVEIER